MCTHNNIATQSLLTGTYETHVHTMYTQCHNIATQSLNSNTYAHLIQPHSHSQQEHMKYMCTHDVATQSLNSDVQTLV
jgi:hypothetical protein